MLKPRSILLKTRKLSPSTAAAARRSHQHQGAPGGAQPKKATAAAHQSKPTVSAERAGKLSLSVASACVIAAAAAAASSLFNDSGSRRVAATAAAAGDMSSWSAQQTAAFLAALGEAVGEEHVSTDEGE